MLTRMADHHHNHSSTLLAAMDRLWFHHIILFSEPLSSTPKPHLKPQPLLTSSLINLPSTSSLSLSSSSADEEIPSPSSEEDLSSSSSAAILEFEKNNDLESKRERGEKERPRRSSVGTSCRARSLSSSPSTAKRVRKNNIGLRKELQKSMSCRSLKELELEEVKGFMDLGFIFNKDQISPRMVSVVPGLLRLGFHKHDDNEEDDEEDRGVIRRPYLSEAWLIRRPDSPLLNLRLPRESAAADMKKHLKFWARIVASEIHQES